MDVIACAIFRDCRLRGVGVVRGVSLPSPIDLTCCPFTLPCDRVITYASRNLFTVRIIQRRTVTWRIPLLNSSLSFEVSAILGDGNFMAFVATLDICGIASRNFISVSMAKAT